MVKKLLFFSFLFFSLSCFSQKTLQNLSASPNPFTTVCKIKVIASTNQEAVLYIKNMLGKSVFKKALQLQKGINTITFNRNNLQNGFYIYSIQNTTEIVSKRFVIR